MSLGRNLLLLLSLAVGPLSGMTASGGDHVDFDREIRPILADRCFHCHGPDAEQREADLRLDQEQAAKADRGGYRAIVNGDVAASHLIERITSEDPDQIMPPPDSARKLSAEEIDTLKRWIAEGATWKAHWAFDPLAREPLPTVRQNDWSRNPIDRFVLARLEQAGFQPAPPVDRSGLIRRLSLDLTGLPPTSEEVERFLSDTRPGAYERLVDRLLNSPRFGERVTSMWLDAARYSDTYGYQVDRDRFVWPWRDWVIESLNANMPYDEFLKNQLAGDLRDGATDRQILATTFNRLHPQKTEGGSVPEEFRTQYVADRIETVATAVMGLTMECCRCHDHKYDPISQREYYQLFAFFNKIDEAGLYSYSTQSVPTPTLWLPSEAERNAIAAAERRVREAEQLIAREERAAESRFNGWLTQNAESVSSPEEKKPADSPAAQTDEEDVGDVKMSDRPHRLVYVDFEGELPRSTVAVPGWAGQGVQLTGDDAVGTGVGDFRRYDPFTIALAMRTEKHPERAVVFHRSLGWTDAGSRGYELLLEEGHLSMALVHFWPGNAIRIRSLEKIPLSKWMHVAVVYDGSSRADGLMLYVDGKPYPVEVVRDKLTKKIAGKDGDRMVLGARGRDSGFRGGQIDEVKIFDRQLSPLEVDELAGGDRLQKLLTQDPESLSPKAQQSLRQHYLLSQDAIYGERLSALRDARAEAASAADSVTEIMVMDEMPEVRTTHLLARGDYDQPTDRVAAATPEILPTFPEDAPRNRLGLARWLTGPTHPLTSRVAVNRFWQLIFGEGLVRTPEDFGTQGQPPTHPALLDFLAAEFIESDWDIKRLVRMMVTSATYRQGTNFNPKLVEDDPENRLLGRAGRRQLPAEMLRDAALAMGGLLIDRRGGPPVKPYEVAVSFKPVKRDQGEGLYRRSVYTYWKRTGPAPAMMALDASKRDVCRVRRPRTQSPLQALVLLNDPQFVEAARKLSERLLRECDVDAVVRRMFFEVLGRMPTDEEFAVLDDLFQTQRDYFVHHTDEAELTFMTGDTPLDPDLPVADVAAGSVLASLLMNFEGFTRYP
ncbi:MAG: DUF1553 domain-containing protein [Planctomycetota bacterium]|nr:DUF1553 domain-containing protein [Planctomycetota bacterium]